MGRWDRAQGDLAALDARSALPSRTLHKNCTVPFAQFLLNQNSADCAFPSRRCPGGGGPNPPPACGALWKMAQLGKRARATPRQAVGGLRQGPQASAWGPGARKGAVWAEGLADGAPWARPGHYQAAGCGLRRCRELRVMMVSISSLRFRKPSMLMSARMASSLSRMPAGCRCPRSQAARSPSVEPGASPGFRPWRCPRCRSRSPVAWRSRRRPVPTGS